MNKKARIVKRTHVDGRISYTIQQRHWLFFWWWCDAWLNSGNPWVDTDFPTYEEAQKNLCYFDGSKETEEVIA